MNKLQGQHVPIGIKDGITYNNYAQNPPASIASGKFLIFIDHNIKGIWKEENVSYFQVSIYKTPLLYCSSVCVTNCKSFYR